MPANSDYLVKIHKAPCDINNIYAKINKDAMFNAMKELNGSGFFLWMYCASQSEKIYNFEFGPAGTKAQIGLSESTFKTAKKELINKGYLVKNGSKIEFYEVPVAQKDKNCTVQESKNQLIIDQSKNQPVQEVKNQPNEDQNKNQPNAQEDKNQPFGTIDVNGEKFEF